MRLAGRLPRRGGVDGKAMLATYPPPQPPAATTEPASDFTATAATLHGTVNPNGVQTEYRFEYGTTSSYGSETEAVEAGHGTKALKASQSVFGLQLGVIYHFRLVAESEAGTVYGEDETFTTKASTGLTLEAPEGGFPASFSLAGEQTVRLRGTTPVNCATESGVKALGGEGQFEDATSGTATLTLHNCKESGFGSKCTTSGQATGTIVTEALPFSLVYLSDGRPGALFLPNPESETVATAKCLSGYVSIEIAGNGVLGQITDPPLGEASPTLTIDLNAPEVGGGKYAQEYTETEADSEYGLQESLNGGALEPAALEAEAVASFGGDIEVRALRPPAATTKAASEVKATTATLNATVNPEEFETTYQFEYVEQAEFEENGYENAVAVPASPKGAGSGTSDVEVSQEITGLTAGSEYRFRIEATNDGGATYGEDETLTTSAERSLALEPPGGEFPASFSLAGAQTVSLVGPEITISCTTSGEVKALGGEGQFEDATSGTATLTLHNCKGPFNVNCTTSGQAAGTIKTEALPFRLAYLSDGEPGIVFEPNAASGLLATAKCSVIAEVKLKGSGVLGQVTEPALDEPSPTLTIDLNAPEGEQQYTETEAEEQYALQMSLNGAALEPAALDAEAVASFGGEVELGEGGGEAEPTELALEPPGGSFPASFSLAGAQTVSLVSPEITITCTTSGEVKALGGEGQFEDATSGTATLTLRNCKGPFGVKCTTSGQTAGTIKTEALPFRLAYLSDGEPGIVFLPNEESGLLAAVKCSVIAEVKLKGSGVLGQITEPALGEPSPTLTIDLNAPEGEQQYTETEAEEQYALQMSLNGAALEPAALDAEAVASFGEGEGTLGEG